MAQEKNPMETGLSDEDIKKVGRVVIGCGTAFVVVLVVVVVLGIVELVKSII